MKLTKKQQHFTTVLYNLGLIPSIPYDQLKQNNWKTTDSVHRILQNARRNFVGDYTEDEQYYYLNIHGKSYKWTNQFIKENSNAEPHTVFESVECKGLGKLVFFNEYYLDILNEEQIGFSLQSVRDFVNSKKWVETN